MRILFAIHQFENPSAGGTEVYTDTLARELSGRNDVAVLYPSAGIASGIQRKKRGDVQLYGIGAGNTRPADPFTENYEGAGLRPSIQEVLDEFTPDVVHIQHLSGLGLSFLEEARSRAARVVMTLPDYWPFCPRGQMIRDDLSNCVEPDTVRCAACVFVEPELENLEARARGLLGPLMAPFEAMTKRAETRAWGRLQMAGLLTRLAGSTVPRVEEAQGKVRRRLDRLRAALHAIDLFIAPSESIGLRYGLLGVPLNKIRHLDYGFAPLKSAGHREPSKGPFRLGFLGSLIPSKGAHVVAHALASLKGANVELHLWGDFFPYHGDTSYKCQLEEALSAVPHHLHGPVRHDEVAGVLGEMDALVVPSLWAENSPLVIHEALQAGVPVIGSRIGGIPELVRDGDTGLLFKAGDPEDLARQITRLVKGEVTLSDPSVWKLAVDPIEEHARRIEQLYLEEPSW